MTVSADSLPISGLQHILYCPRQCALIHLENIWSENLYTTEGRILHERADDGGQEKRKDRITRRSVHIYSAKYGIHGIADVVEYVYENGSWIPCPIEYKRGKPKKNHEDEVQLCAQALCLEEMHGCSIPSGNLFYGKTRRHAHIAFDRQLRDLTLAAIDSFRQLIKETSTPMAPRSPKCENCSLLDHCMPEALRFKKGMAAWNNRAFNERLDGNHS